MELGRNGKSHILCLPDIFLEGSLNQRLHTFQVYGPIAAGVLSDRSHHCFNHLTPHPHLKSDVSPWVCLTWVSRLELYVTEIISVECTHVHGQAWTPNSCSTQQELSVVKHFRGTVNKAHGMG